MKLIHKSLILILVIHTMLFANQTIKTAQIENLQSISMDISVINGTSGEYVYDGNNKLSELTWRLNDVKLPSDLIS